MAAKKKTKKKGAKAAGVAEVADPREKIPPTKANLEKVLKEVEAVLSVLPKPEEPQPAEFVDSLLHIVFGDGLPCGVPQEIQRRIEAEYVDRNEYRVTEAYETAEILADLELPDEFERCHVAKESVAQIHNDQNHVTLEFMREAALGERKGFYARVPIIAPLGVRYINTMVALDEILFSPRSTQRTQQRLGFDPKAKEVEAFFERLRELVAPFGQLPHFVAPQPENPDGKPIMDPVLCPACAVARICPK